MSSPCTRDRDSDKVECTGKAARTVVMVRHGQSVANVQVPKIYSGWENVALTDEGIQQAKRAGITLRDAGFKFDVAYTSLLTRAQNTLEIILEELGQRDIPVHRTWRLNERHFGEMNGMNVDQIVEKYGEHALNPFNTPPPMTESHPQYESIRENIAQYKEVPTPNEFPRAESLKQTVERTLPYWTEVVVPQILKGKTVLIVGHGSNLKGLVMHLDGMPEEDATKFVIPNATPFLYEFDENMKPVVSFKYLPTK